jgi:hypothetical protein
VADIKAHSFFASVDFATVWSIPAPTIDTGMTKPKHTVEPSADVWAVFDEEAEESNGGFEYDDNDDDLPGDGMRGADEPTALAAGPVERLDDTADLGFPRRAWLEEHGIGQKKGRHWSQGSEGTSSSGGNRAALNGLLEGLGLSGGRTRSSRASGTSVRSDEIKALQPFRGGQSPAGYAEPTHVGEERW